MKLGKNLLFYVTAIAILGLFGYFISMAGASLRPIAAVETATRSLASNHGWQGLFSTLFQNAQHPIAISILQILIILLVARIFGLCFGWIGQPSVIGEIAAGIFLGPSLIGHFFPGFSSFLFPAASIGHLQFLSQIGLILFMFVIGMGLDGSVLKKKAKEAVIISHAGIMVPFVLGMGLAYFLFERFSLPGISFLGFSLFMGISMSVTAFPVLARILHERGLTTTRVGIISLACAAADDVTAWCILAGVIAVVKAGNFHSAFFSIGLTVLVILVMLYFFRPLLRLLGPRFRHHENVTLFMLSAVCLVLLLCSYLTEIIGIHALFGAFMAGVIMPPIPAFRKILRERIEDISVVLLLPLFFVFTGLRTQVSLINSPQLWLICLVIILVAVAGKLGGCTLAARASGNCWRESLSIGSLMNTRGLMELVVLNIGYDLGVLSPEMFTLLVIMALITTFMTSPALWVIEKAFGRSLLEQR